MPLPPHMKKLLFAVYLIAAALTAQAGGFQVNSQGQKALGMGGAFTAYNKDASAAYFNPGALALLDSGRYFSIGASYIMPRTTFLSEKTGQAEDMEPQNFLPAYLYAAIPVSDRLTLGLSLNSPFQMKSKWNDNWEGRAINQEISLQTYYVQPTASFRVSNNFSLGAGLVYAYSDLKVRRQIGEFNGNGSFSGTASCLGYNVGIYGKVQDEISFGITYRSTVNFNYDNGEAVFTNIPAPLSSQYQNQGFESDITMPSTLSVGLSNRITDKVLLAFEFNLTGWANYDSLNFNFADQNTPDSRSPRKFEDAMAFRVGLNYSPTEKLEVRGGAYFDETPVRDEYISPDYPDGNRLGFTTGLTYKLNDKFSIDGAFMFEKVTDRNAVADEINVQISNISGTYRTYVTGAGLGLNYNF